MHFAFLLRSKGHISINISLHHLSQIQFTRWRSLYEDYSLFGWLVPIASSSGIQSIFLGVPILCEIESGFIISHQSYKTCGLQCHVGSHKQIEQHVSVLNGSHTLYQMSDHLIFYRAFSLFSVLAGCQWQLLRAGGPAYTGALLTAPKNLPVRTFAAVK